jgi:hypothetical protein
MRHILGVCLNHSAPQQELLIDVSLAPKSILKGIPGTQIPEDVSSDACLYFDIGNIASALGEPLVNILWSPIENDFPALPNDDISKSNMPAQLVVDRIALFIALKSVTKVGGVMFITGGTSFASKPQQLRLHVLLPVRVHGELNLNQSLANVVPDFGTLAPSVRLGVWAQAAEFSGHRREWNNSLSMQVNQNWPLLEGMVVFICLSGHGIENVLLSAVRACKGTAVVFRKPDSDGPFASPTVYLPGNLDGISHPQAPSSKVRIVHKASVLLINESVFTTESDAWIQSLCTAIDSVVQSYVFPAPKITWGLVDLLHSRQLDHPTPGSTPSVAGRCRLNNLLRALHLPTEAQTQPEATVPMTPKAFTPKALSHDSFHQYSYLSCLTPIRGYSIMQQLAVYQSAINTPKVQQLIYIYWSFQIFRNPRLCILSPANIRRNHHCHLRRWSDR